MVLDGTRCVLYMISQSLDWVAKRNHKCADLKLYKTPTSLNVVNPEAQPLNVTPLESRIFQETLNSKPTEIKKEDQSHPPKQKTKHCNNN